MTRDDGAGCRVTVCRECEAVGRRRIDPEAQAARLAETLTPAHRVRTSLCLDACSQANVMVVHPTPAARRAGARPVWFGLVEGAVLDDIAEWVEAGGPGVAPLPVLLELSVLPPEKRF